MIPRRRIFGVAAVLATGSIMPACAIRTSKSAASWNARQFHNQPEESHQHQFLAGMWEQVARETDGRFRVTVYAQNDHIKGSDPAALELLIKGDLEFFSLMGGILGRAVPVAEIQGLPFAFTSHQQVHAANDGALGAVIGRECAARGIYRFPRGLLENGFRQISTIDRPVNRVEDLEGVRMRVPDGEMFRDLFASLGATPATINILDLYEALKQRRVDGQENPLVITEVNKLYEVTRYVAVSNHMWSGFNELANARFWNGLPADVREIIERNVTIWVARQRSYTDALNGELASRLAGRGMVFNRPDVGSFRSRLGGGFYERWRRQLGAEAWAALEQYTGALS